jgi:hypothetical protein
MNRLWIVVVTAVLAFLHANTVCASQIKLEAVLPENQLSGGPENAIYVRLSPGQTETFTFRVTNQGETTVVVPITVGTAQTGADGQVNFAKNDTTDHLAGLPFLLGDFLHVSQSSLKLISGESKEFTVTLHMPDRSFTGQLLGGVSVEKNGIADTLQVPILVEQSEKSVAMKWQITGEMTEEGWQGELRNKTLRYITSVSGKVTAFSIAGDKIAEQNFSDWTFVPGSSMPLDLPKHTRKIQVMLTGENWQKNISWQKATGVVGVIEEAKTSPKQMLNNIAFALGAFLILVSIVGKVIQIRKRNR